MAQNSDNCSNSKSFSSEESSSNKSFVKKVKSRVSGFIPSSITKWFGNKESHVRQREESDDDDEDEYFEIQPPSKRKKPSEVELSAHDFQISSMPILTHKTSTPNQFSTINHVNHVEKKTSAVFPEPIAGPSGIQSRKTFAPLRSGSYNRISVTQDILNGDKDSDSGESTSGYSSNHKVETKQTKQTKISETQSDLATDVNNSGHSLNTSLCANDRSLFSEKSFSHQLNTSLSSRQPTFNASMFGSPNFVDRTLSSKRIMNSPFYNGRTIYGGASAYGRRLGRPSSDIRSTIKNTAQFKPVNEKSSNDNMILSKTARRILDTLEQYSTPIAEAKKIPNPSLRRNTKYASPYTHREHKVSSNKELQVPSVPDLLKMKLKERLQDSTVSVRHIATTSKSVLNMEEYKLRPTDEDTTKHISKMKTKVSSVRQKPTSDETVPEVKLPEVQLPISTLPKFDFTLPDPQTRKSPVSTVTTKAETVSTSTTFKSVEKTSTMKFQNKVETKTISTKEVSSMTETCKARKKTESNKTENCRTESSNSEIVKITEYKFADPVVLAENFKPIKAINNYIFSEPVSKKQGKSALEIDVSSNFKCPDTLPTLKTTSRNNSVAGSVMDVLSKKDTPANSMDSPKPAAETWECPVCLIRNLAHRTKCEACEAPKSQSGFKSQTSVVFGDKSKKSALSECKSSFVVNSSDKNISPKFETNPPKVNTNSGFGNQFKLSSSKWECDTCLVRNNNTDIKCVACSTLRVTKNGNANPSSSTASLNSFGEKFKPPSNSWECSTCMIRNKNELLRCVACESPKPSFLSDKKVSEFDHPFKKKDNEWECDTCMVRNPSDKVKCQCCESPKPGAEQSLNEPKEGITLSSFNFGIDKNSRTTLQGFTFGINPSENKSSAPVPSIFDQAAANAATSTPVEFTFGIKPVQDVIEKKEEKKKPTETSVPQSVAIADNSSVAGKTISEVNPPTTGFVFQTNPSEARKRKTNDETSSVNSKKSDLIESKVNHQFVQGNSEASNNKPVSLNGDINKGDSLLKSALNSAPHGPEVSKETPVSSAPGTLFSFGVKPPVFGANTNTQATSFKFAPTETKPVVNDKPSIFGSPTVNAVGSSSAFVGSNASAFGSSNAQTFGKSATSAATFGTQSVVEAKPFAFGNTVQGEPAAKVSAFSFEESAKPAMFNFSNPTAQNLPNTFNFTPSANQPSSGFNFNPSPSNCTTFGSLPQPAQNGAFNFGSNVNNTPKTGFNFGATQPVPGANTQGVFSFGAPSNPPAAGSSGFNFGSSDVKPNYNFMAGTAPPTFNAQPSSEKPRVIRKAVRRTQR